MNHSLKLNQLKQECESSAQVRTAEFNTRITFYSHTVLFIILVTFTIFTGCSDDAVDTVSDDVGARDGGTLSDTIDEGDAQVDVTVQEDTDIQIDVANGPDMNESDMNEPDVPDSDVGSDANDVPVAPADNDSLADPAMETFLSITGTRNFSYTNEVSAPVGDAKDFVEFEFPNNNNPNQVVEITLTCTLTGAGDRRGAVRIFENGVSTNATIACNDGPQNITVNNTMVQVAEIEVFATEQTHMAYTITVVGFQ